MRWSVGVYSRTMAIVAAARTVAALSGQQGMEATEPGPLSKSAAHEKTGARTPILTISNTRIRQL